MPRIFLFAVVPDFKREGKVRIIAEGSSIREVEDKAKTVIGAEHGTFWNTAWRQVMIGNKSQIQTGFRIRLNDAEFRSALKEFHKKMPERAPDVAKAH